MPKTTFKTLLIVKNLIKISQVDERFITHTYYGCKLLYYVNHTLGLEGVYGYQVALLNANYR